MVVLVALVETPVVDPLAVWTQTAGRVVCRCHLHVVVVVRWVVLACVVVRCRVCLRCTRLRVRSRPG